MTNKNILKIALIVTAAFLCGRVYQDLKHNREIEKIEMMLPKNIKSFEEWKASLSAEELKEYDESEHFETFKQESIARHNAESF